MVKKNSREIVNMGWVWTSDGNDAFTTEAIRTAATVDAARSLDLIARVLERIESHILSLGRDGLHDVIRHEAERVRRQERLTRARAKAERARKKAERKAAGGQP